MRRFVLGMVCAVGLGCAGATEPDLGEEFELRVGDHAVVADAGFWVVFVGVGEDSRCPLRAQCVWAGDAAVVVETGPLPDPRAQERRADTLHTTLEPRNLALGTVELTLIGLDPYPETPGSIRQNQYVATFTVRAVP